MGRKSHSRSLGIWINGVRAATWTLLARGDMQLQYEPDWVASERGARSRCRCRSRSTTGR